MMFWLPKLASRIWRRLQKRLRNWKVCWTEAKYSIEWHSSSHGILVCINEHGIHIPTEPFWSFRSFVYESMTLASVLYFTIVSQCVSSHHKIHSRAGRFSSNDNQLFVIAKYTLSVRPASSSATSWLFHTVIVIFNLGNTKNGVITDWKKKKW